MKSDELELLRVMWAATVDGQEWINACTVAENLPTPIHERRVLHFIKKWKRRDYWYPLMMRSGQFTPEGREWLASLGITT